MRFNHHVSREKWNRCESLVIALDLVSINRFFCCILCFIAVGAERITSQYALVEFEEKDEVCTAVVPFNRICSASEGIQNGDAVKVLWHNKREYPAKFILSGLLLI